MEEGSRINSAGVAESDLNRCHAKAAGTTDLSEQRRSEGEGGEETEPGGRRSEREVARRICILIRNLAESFLRSPSFPILFYTIPLVSEG